MRNYPQCHRYVQTMRSHVSVAKTSLPSWLTPCASLVRGVLRQSGCTLPVAALLLGLPTVSQGAPVPSTFNLSSLNGSNGFVVNGTNANDRSGFSVSGAGDINGDGIHDLIIGADGADPNGRSRAGKSHVVFGDVGVGSTGALNLASLNGENGFVINGIDAADYSGLSVSGAGDINGDGVDDLIIGAASADPNGNLSGESYIVFGGSAVGFGGSLNLSDLNGSNGFVLNGIDAGDFSGRSVSGAGDINGDGIDDLIVGAHFADPGNNSASGESYVVFGGGTVGSSGVLELSSLDGSNGFVVNGVGANDRSGLSVSGAGDINGDGIQDLIIGAYRANPGDTLLAGESYIVFGGSGVGNSGSLNLSDLNGNNGFALSGIDSLDMSGRSVSAAGDINDDGVDDLLIGADQANNLAGESYVVYGGLTVGSGGVVNLASLNASGGFVLTGIDASDYSGRSVSGAGDVNGDGIGDLIIGADGAESNGNSGAGESYVVFGDSAVGTSGSFSLASLNGSNGFVLSGTDVSDRSGQSVSGVGDINGDGVNDLLIGAFDADPDANNSAGISYVVFMPLPDTAEPNNTPSNATPISVGETLSNNLAPLGDVDRFSFSLSRTQRVVISTGNDGTAEDHDTLVELFDESNTLLGSNDDFPELGTFSSLSITLSAGNYQFAVTENLGDEVIPSYLVSLRLSTLVCRNRIVTVDLAVGDTPTNGNDVIQGTIGNDIIDALDGDDVVCAGPGDDIVFGGNGNDIIDGGGDNDTLSGDVGNDSLFGSAGNDLLLGGVGNDTIVAGGGDDDIQGEDGNDTLFGQIGDDAIDGGAGVDAINGGPGNDVIFTGTGATVGSGIFVTGSGGDDTITGGPDADDLRGAQGADIINGEAGNDQISGGPGRDMLSGGSGNDELLGQESRDMLFGGSGNDELSGGDENDQLNGDEGNDELNGGPGRDVVRGNDGDDMLLGGSGDDTLVGGAGIDVCNGQSDIDSAVASCETVIGVP